jgi:hypothetical protein
MGIDFLEIYEAVTQKANREIVRQLRLSFCFKRS